MPFQGWILNALSGSGIDGAFIFVLLCGLTGLWLAFRRKDSEIRDLHSARALEREVMAKMIEQASASSAAMASATEKRNEVMTSMANTITALTAALDKYEERVQLQSEMLSDRFADFRHVVDSFGESNRVISGTLAEVRNQQGTLISAVTQMNVTILAEMKVLAKGA